MQLSLQQHSYKCTRCKYHLWLIPVVGITNILQCRFLKLGHVMQLTFYDTCCKNIKYNCSKPSLWLLHFFGLSAQRCMVILKCLFHLLFTKPTQMFIHFVFYLFFKQEFLRKGSQFTVYLCTCQHTVWSGVLAVHCVHGYTFFLFKFIFEIYFYILET